MKLKYNQARETMPLLLISSDQHEPVDSLSSKNAGITIACEFQDGVVIGADSRRTTGDYISNRQADKLIKIHDRIYCAGSGPSSVTQSIIDNAMYQISILEMDPEEVSVSMVAAIFRGHCNFSPDAEFLIVGWDGILGGQVYALSSRRIMKRGSIFLHGSGSPYVYGFVDSIYKKNMYKYEAEDFVVKTLKLAMARDSLSGGEIDLIVITKDSVELKSSK